MVLYCSIPFLSPAADDRIIKTQKQEDFSSGTKLAWGPILLLLSAVSK